MLSETEFVEQVKNAYEHLYDLVHLRTHPLAEALVPDPALRLRERAWQFHHILSEVIEELNPGSQAPIFSREWRRYRLMVLHYLDGLDPQAVADELNISRRHYYREHEAALKAIASILWNRYKAQPATSQPVLQTDTDQPSPSRLELLRLEAARAAQTDRYTYATDVIQGVCSLLQEMLYQRSLKVELRLPDALSGVSIDQILLRQMLLGLMGYLIEQAEQATILLLAQVGESTVHLSLTVDPPTALHPLPLVEVQERLATFEEMAEVSDAQILPISKEQLIIGFEVTLPVSPQRTVLVVDDNEDVLALFHRYLSLHHYDVITAQTAQDALALARQFQPYAITLDLMMPDQDGWDLLQVLLNQPETQHIPIIVCSVLKQKELSLSLGAAAFLEKPISEQALLSALDALEEK